ncbi:MAG TPA: PAS domain S-box protein [Flavisolibacter sp.]|nr:PAS domain S-box protein [Flavisolibacter sp.]
MTAEQNAIDFRSVFNSLPGSNILVMPDAPRFTIHAVSDAYLQSTGRSRDDLVGKGLFEAFPNNPDDPNSTSEKMVRASLEYSLHHKEKHFLPLQRYDILTADGSYDVRYWLSSNRPVLTENGEVGFLIHSAEDVTEKKKSEERDARLKSLEKAYQLFMNAPVIIGILRGDDYTIELANEGLLDVWGRAEEVIGKPLLKAIPELESQGFIELLDQVRKTGEPYYAYERPITLVRHGKSEVVYFDFVYKPYYHDDNGKVIDGVFAVGHNVTDKVLAKRKVHESEEKYYSLFEAMDQGFCVMEMLYNSNQQAYDYRFLEVNPVFEKQTGLKDAINKTAKELVPHLEQQWVDRYASVAETGISIRFTQGSEAMGRWFDVYAFRVGGNESRKVALLFTDITQQKTTEKELNRAKERFELVSKATQDAIWDWDLTTNEVWWNEGFKSLFGYAEEEIEATTESWHSRLHPEEREQVIDDIQRTIDSGTKNWSKEYRFRKKDGSYSTVLDRGYALHDETGKPYRMLGAMQDITLQEISRREAEESAQQIRALIESAPFPIGVYIGREMRIAFVNQSIIDVWGKGPDVVGKTYAEVLPELATQHIYTQLDNVYSTGLPFHAKNQRVDLVVDDKLQPFYFNYSFTPLFDAQGKVYGVMNTAADVTDLMVAKQQVEQSERNFRSMILQSPVAMCILLGPEHVVDIANDTMFELWGKSKETMLNKPIFVGLPDAKEQGLEQLLRDVYHNGISVTASERPVQLVRKGVQETVYINFNYEPYWDADGFILGILAVAVDVTEQVLSRHKIEEVVIQRTKELASANDSLIKSNEELKHTNANLEEFTYAASHDLKEPVRKIHVFSGRLKDSLGNRMTNTEKNFFERIELASRRMSTLIDDLLTYSEVGHQAAFEDEVNLNDLVRQVLHDLDLEIEQKQAMIQVQPLFNIKGHQRQLLQAFQNLVSNALKYSKADTPPVIEISCSKLKGSEAGLRLNNEEQQKEFYQVTVRDNGIGFDQANAERIFNVFTRLHGRAEYKGTGIGLSIVRKVVQSHNGHVWAESAEGKGATFRLLFPVRN